MKKLTHSAAFAVLVSLAPTVDAQRLVRAPAGQGARWAADGKHIVFRGATYDPTTWQVTEQKIAAASTPRSGRPARARLAAALEKRGIELGERGGRGRGRGGVSRGTLPRQPLGPAPAPLMSADGLSAAVVRGDALWVWKDGGEARKLPGDFSNIRRVELAPDGSAVSYIKDFDLHVTNTANGRTVAITDDGGENTFYGELDWVYQEEVYGRGNFKATWWAPDSGHLAYMRIDETGVDTFTVVNHVPDQLDIETLKYPKSGRINPRATLRIARGDGAEDLAVDLGRYRPEQEILIVRVGWTPEADRCVFMVQNREQTWLDLNFADPATGQVATIIHESCDDGWVNRLPMPRWLDDGSFLWESERTGFRHLYRYDRSGKLLATVSKGEWEVRRIIRLDEKQGWIAFYGSTPEYAIGQNAYRAALDGSELRRLTKGRGSHTVSFNEDGSMYLDSFNSLENPGEQWLRKADSTDVRKIHATEMPRGANVAKWHQIKARDGETLDVTYRLPAGFNPRIKYPVWINTYSGPNSPTVRDRWSNPPASDWYVALQVNVRSASGRGMKYTKRCYKQFGVQELKDIEDAIDWLCDNHEWADAARVGITGWSYGGFMTAFAMTHSDKFRCGIAGAGVYDWRLYDTIYTERYMATPQNNTEGYDLTSCITAAKNLSGHLLIVHGTMDDNVHMQNAIQLIDALQEAGKMNFEFMIYPESRHGVRSPHLTQLRQHFMRKHL